MTLAIEINQTFVTGSAAFISSIIVFVGSVFLLLALIMGARLAYMLTASITLGFVLIMGAVWSIGEPLGPVGQLPEWHSGDIAEEASTLEFGPAADYPEGDWYVPAEEDATAGELESAATDVVTAAIDEEQIGGYEDPSTVAVVADSVRFYDQGSDRFGMVSYEGLEGTEGEGGPNLFVVMEFDPGNPSGPARMITAGTFILFVGHLIGLSRMEKKAAKRDEAA
ncbi:MAG: hypothetical protein ACLGHL_03065 [Actinomycetota bacterium]